MLVSLLGSLTWVHEARARFRPRVYPRRTLIRAYIPGHNRCSFDARRWEMATLQQICPVRHEVNVVIPRAVRVGQHSVAAIMRPRFCHPHGCATHRVLLFVLTLHRRSPTLQLPVINVVDDVLFFSASARAAKQGRRSLFHRNPPGLVVCHAPRRAAYA